MINSKCIFFSFCNFWLRSRFDFSQVEWHLYNRIKEFNPTAILTSVTITIHVNIKWGEHVVLVWVVCLHQIQLGHKCLDTPRDAVLGGACYFLCFLHRICVGIKAGLCVFSAAGLWIIAAGLLLFQTCLLDFFFALQRKTAEYNATCRYTITNTSTA